MVDLVRSRTDRCLVFFEHHGTKAFGFVRCSEDGLAKLLGKRLTLGDRLLTVNTEFWRRNDKQAILLDSTGAPSASAKGVLSTELTPSLTMTLLTSNGLAVHVNASADHGGGVLHMLRVLCRGEDGD